MTFVYFIVMVGVLVFVHELGHFIFARMFGVRVLTFSLGFGPRIAGFRRGGTEYVLSALPLGGYVRMLGENPRDEVRPAERATSFASQSIWRRMVIASGGPLMNLAFPIALYFVVFLGDTEQHPASIGRVYPHRPAEGKLQPGDRVTAVDGEAIDTWYELNRLIARSAGTPLRLRIERGDKTLEHTITPVAESKELLLELREEVGVIGISAPHPLAVIGVRSPTSPAWAAELRTFDVVISAGGRPIRRWLDLERALEKNRGTLVPLTYLSPTPVENALGGLVALDVYDPRIAALTPEPGTGSGIERAGIELADLYVGHVAAGSPEQRIGLRKGDRLLELDGRPVPMWETYLEDLRAAKGGTHELRWHRGGETHSARFALPHESGVSEHGQRYDRYVVGISHWLPMRLDPPVPNPSPLLYAVREALRATADVVELTVFSVVRLLQGRLSMKSIGGPLTILDVAGTAAREGALNFLTSMAFISINLGLINLLPIPLLDGGHMMFLMSEAVLRRPVSARIREYAHIAGLVVLLAIMVLAFKNDIERRWPSVADEAQSGE